MIEVVPGALCKTKEDLEEKTAMFEPISDKIHLDMGDGIFVPNRTVTIEEILEVKTNLSEILHLMLESPLEVVKKIPSQSSIKEVIFHAEITQNFLGLIGKIKELGLEVGVALSPKTGIDKIRPIINFVDMVLVLTVLPGFMGQRFIEGPLQKVQNLRVEYPNLKIGVDGGMKPENVKLAVEAGASVIFSSSYILRSPNKRQALEELRKVIE